MVKTLDYIVIVEERLWKIEKNFWFPGFSIDIQNREFPKNESGVPITVAWGGRRSRTRFEVLSAVSAIILTCNLVGVNQFFSET
jgi:hypothetical protein